MKRPKAIFTLDENIISELNAVAEELHEKKSHIVEKALTMYFDILDIRIADKRISALKPDELIPAEDVFKALNL